jgi:hypothetical protein
MRARMCAYVRACRGACMHMCISESVRVRFLFLHHLLEIFSGVGLHALRATLLILKLWCFCNSAEPLPVKPLAAVKPCEGFPSRMCTALAQKQLACKLA